MWVKGSEVAHDNERDARMIFEASMNALSQLLVQMIYEMPEVDFDKIPGKVMDKLTKLFEPSEKGLEMHRELSDQIPEVVFDYLRKEIPEQIPEEYFSFLPTKLCPNESKDSIVSFP